jgi:hypothetical protein
MAKITTIPLFLKRVIGVQGFAGTALSDVVDLRDISEVGRCSMTYTIHGGGTSGSDATSGSSSFQYLVSATTSGVFRAAGTFGTHGVGLENDILNIANIVAPFMQIKVVTGTSNAMMLSAELHVQ